MVNAIRQNQDKHPVTSKTSEIDKNNLAWSTCCKLGMTGQSPGSEILIVLAFRKLLKLIPDDWNLFVNPKFSVTSDSPTDAFLHSARKAQNDWLHQYRSGFHSSGAVKRHRKHHDLKDPILSKRELKQTRALLRQLEETGVLILDGKHIAPSDWPNAGSQLLRKQDLLIGRKFGRLSVQASVSRQRCQCQCECGNVKTVKASHLLSGKTKSCGCLRDEMETEAKNKKERRAWLYTGNGQS